MKLHKMSPRDKHRVLRFARAWCKRWSAEVLDCSKSFRRQPVSMDFESIMAKFHDRAHFNVCKRNDWDGPEIEVSFRASDPEDDRVDWFLFIWLDVRHEADIEAMCSQTSKRMK